MKTILPLPIAAAVMLAVSASPSSAETQTERDDRMAERPISEEIEDSTVEFGYPFKVIGRAGVSVLRAPLILGETLIGERRVLSEQGILVREESLEETRTDRARR